MAWISRRIRDRAVEAPTESRPMRAIVAILLNHFGAGIVV